MIAAFVASQPRGLDPDIVKPGWIALVVVVLLCVGVYVLARSFMKHTRRASQPWAGDDADVDASTPDDPDARPGTR